MLYWKFILYQLRTRIGNDFTLLAIFLPLIQLPVLLLIEGTVGNIIGTGLVIIQLTCAIAGFFEDYKK
jgi:hypothetical protein